MPTVVAQYDPARVKASSANSRRGGWIAVVVCALLAVWALLLPSSPDMIPGWIAAIVFVALAALIWLGLYSGRRAVHRLTVDAGSRTGLVALAVSPTGVRMSVGPEVPWAAIRSVHLLDTRSRTFGTPSAPGREAGAALGAALMSSVGVGRSQAFVLLRDGRAFAQSLGDATAAKRVRLWPGSTPQCGDVTVLLDPLVPPEQVQSVLDALVDGCTGNAVPVINSTRGADLLRALAEAAKD